MFSDEREPEVSTYSEPRHSSELLAEKSENISHKAEVKDTYQINFNNVSIIEYIRFASKVANLNFIFDDKDLQFAVTIVSEEEVSPKNILSILIQVLRIHGLIVLEQENNLLITPSRNVSQLATVIGSEDKNALDTVSPLVTRVFRIHKANLGTVANIIKPMLSDSSLLEMSAETQQIIVTDITTNVDKIAILLDSIDTPHTGLEIESYTVHYTSPEELVQLAQRLMEPFIDGASFTLAPHEENGTIFIISTPALVEKALTILEDIDVPKKARISHGADQVFIYTLEHQTGEGFLASAKLLAEDLEKRDASQELIKSLEEAKWIKESNAILFMGSAKTLEKIKDLLPQLDVKSARPTTTSNFLVYAIHNDSEAEMRKGLEQLALRLEKAPHPDEPLIHAIRSASYIPESNSLIFTGNTEALSRLEPILPSFDIVSEATKAAALNKAQAPIPPKFELYKLEHTKGSVVLEKLQEVARNLQDSGVPSDSLIKALHEVKWIKDTNSILITASPQDIDHVKELVAQFDTSAQAFQTTPDSQTSFFIYKPLHQTPQAIIHSLQDFSKDLEASGLVDPDLIVALKSERYIEQSQSILFTGSPTSLDKVREILARFDTPTSRELEYEQLGEYTFFIYKIKEAPPQQLMSALRGLATELHGSGALDANVALAINSMKWVKETNSLLFTGTPETLHKVEALVRKFDVAPADGATIKAPLTPPSHYVVYTPKYQPGDELMKMLEDFQRTLAASGVSDQALFDTIEHLQWMPRQCSIVIAGTPDSIQKVENLLQKFDIPSHASAATTPAIASIDNTSFLVYKLQYHQGSDILSALKLLTPEITSSGTSSNQSLINTIHSLQWIQVTNSIIASGEQTTLSKLKELIESLDVPLRQVYMEVLIIETDVFNSQNFGLQWGGKYQYLDRAAIGSGNFPLTSQPGTGSTSLPNSNYTGGIAPGINAVNPPKSVFPSVSNVPFLSGFDLGIIGDVIMHKGQSYLSLGALVNALQADVDSTIVMNPTLVTQDNKNSTLFVGNNIPFAGSLVTTNAQNVQSAANLEYRDVGFNLSITPTIGNDNVVSLDISVDISEVTNQGSVTTSTIDGTTTTHTNMMTHVHVPNEHFVVLSGMIHDVKTRFRTGIPCLGGLPVIGVIFSENDRLNSKRNIIFFLRPRVVDTYDQYKEVTTEKENLFKENAVLPILQEEFDAGLDLMKTAAHE